ncbi:hypothetical protein Tco_0638265 [Tanacetum coccineum]
MQLLAHTTLLAQAVFVNPSTHGCVMTPHHVGWRLPIARTLRALISYFNHGQGSVHGSAPVEDDSPVKEVVAPVKAKKVSKRRQKIVTTENKESAKP